MGSALSFRRAAVAAAPALAALLIGLLVWAGKLAVLSYLLGQYGAEPEGR
jgi:hypothetical protein